MVRRLGHGFALSLSLCIGMYLLFFASGSVQATDGTEASPPVHPELQDSLSTEQPSIPQEQVASYAEYRGISNEDARMLLAVEEELRKSRSAIRERIGDTFAGISVNDELIGEITVRTTGSGRQPLEAAREESDIRRVFEHEVVDHSYTGLKEAMGQIRSSSAALVERYGYVYAALDERRNAAVVGVQNDPDATQSKLRDEFGDEVVAVYAEPGAEEHVPSSSLACDFDAREHCNPLRGGTALHPAGGSGPVCTLGFNAYDKVYTHVPFVITAGHCDAENHHSQERIGPFSFRHNADEVDAVRIEIREPGWQDSFYFYRRPTAQAVQVDEVWRGGTISQGSGISVSAANSDAYMTGEVRSGNVQARGHHGMIGYDMCTQGGDSGSPVVVSDTAIAVHEGDYSDYVKQPDGCYKMGSYVENVEDELSVRIRTNSDDP